MNKIALTFILIVSISFSSFSQFSLSKKASEHYYTNPILTGMNPDPSICRVDDDYYLVTSSFGFYPGLPVYHSLDLVNWELIGHGINRTDQLALREDKNDVLNLFAATIRYHNGIFYIINTNTGRRDKNRNFVITATNPAGPWSDAIYIEEAPFIDPSLFFDDDGKVYYAGNQKADNAVAERARNIWTQEIDPLTWKLKGEPVVIIDCNPYYNGLTLIGQESALLNHFEGPHIYKKDGTYYLLLSHGGTDWGHAVSIWKSDKVFGPFEMCPNNPIVTNRDLSHDTYIHHTGHADLVQTQNNEWWMVLLGSRPYGGEFTNLGRETCLVPVDWSGTWPEVNPLQPAGRVMPVHRRPNLSSQAFSAEEIRDNFDEKDLALCWNFIQTPVEKWWELDKPKGQLKIELRPEVIEMNVNPSFIGRRQAHKNFTATTKMEFVAKAENERAGLTITRDASNQFQVVCTQRNGQQYVQLIRKEVINQDGEIKNSNNETLKRKEAEHIIAEKSVDSKIVFLRMEVLEQLFSFSYSVDGENWEMLAENQDGRMLSFGLGIGRFTGTFVGMYASSNGVESENFVLFDWFDYASF
jgi:alpha-N-arabinofuranosidase